MIKSDLPFGSQFSPSQIELPMLLEIAKEVGGDWKKFEGQVHDAYFKNYKNVGVNRRKLINTKLGTIAYGIIEREAYMHIWRTASYNEQQA